MALNRKRGRKMSELILRFEEITKDDVAAAGGKGANLGEMTRASIPVPAGFVVTAAAYELYMERNSIVPETYEDSEKLRGAIQKGQLPEEIRRAVLEVYQSLRKPVAVRSSATAEDLEDASFAGQQETYLNVNGEEALFDAVRNCYASLWGERAISYRKTTGYDRMKVSLAVVIQEMVESESAGVMFTSDPSGDPANVHVNASYGLGEAVVSGLVSPDEYITDREGNLLNVHTGSKEIQIVYREKGTGKIPVPEELRKKNVLNAEQVAALVKEGVRIEKHYGHPMDIEWAVRDGKIYILQARSITTLGREKEKAFNDKDFEGLPRVKAAKGAMRENVLFNLEKTPIPYTPLDHDFGGYVGTQKEILFNQIGLKFGDAMYPINEDGISLMGNNRVSLTRNIFSLPKYLKIVKDKEGNIRRSEDSLQECEKTFEAEKEKACKTTGEIGAALKRMRNLIGKTAYDRFLYALFPNFLESRKVTKALKEVDPKLNSFDILEGLHYVTADINRELAGFAARINRDPEMAAYVDTHSYREITARYPELREAFEAFMKRFGSKSDFNCYCFAAQTWREDRERFISVLRPMIRSGGAKVLSLEEGKKKFDALMREVQGKVSVKQYRQFTGNVKALRHYHYIREATQYLWESEFEYCRELLRKLAGLTGITYDDLQYLFAEELYEMCENGKTEQAMALIKRRKAKRPLAVAYWNKCMEDALATEDNQITGIGGSVGQSRGKVCIVKSPAEFGKLSQGDILVCTYTDPEWTPLFTLAAGVVVDTGGTLSHAAIVAREYGIPAVLAAGDATRKLKDGDTVLVDGTAGKVTVVA